MGRGSKGFTLIELLVVIAIIGILAALLFPAVQSAMIKAKAVRVGSDGRQVHMGLYGSNTERVKNSLEQIWPDANYAGTATDYLKMCIESNFLENFSVRDLGGPGLPQPNGTNSTDLLPANVAWCITVGCNDENTPLDTPFLFTRNFKGGTTLDGINSLDDTEKLFGNKVGVVITFGGRVRILNGKDFKNAADGQKLFNPSDSKLKFVRP